MPVSILPRSGALARVLLVCLLAFAAAPPLWAANDNDQLHRYFDGLKTLQAHFTQVVFGDQSQTQNKSYGTISVSRPNRFRLVYTKPYHQIYVADGHKLWSYDEGLEQITVKPQKGLLANSPAMLLSDPRKLDKDFIVKALGKRQGMDWFELTPRRKNSNFQHIALAFAHNQLQVMVLKDALGQTTRLDFSDIRYNKPIAPGTFHFVPPKGVDVLGE